MTMLKNATEFCGGGGNRTHVRTKSTISLYMRRLILSFITLNKTIKIQSNKPACSPK